MALSERELKILRGIALQDGVHTARKFWRVLWAKNDAYKVVFRLWQLGLVKAPWLRLWITPASRATLGAGDE